MLEVDAPLEGVVVIFVPLLRRVGLRHAEQLAELAREHLEIRRFRAAGPLPAVDKGIDFGGVDTVLGTFRLRVTVAHSGTIAARTVGESPLYSPLSPGRYKLHGANNLAAASATVAATAIPPMTPPNTHDFVAM